MNQNSNNVVFLIGSGASITAGMPSTAELTEYILSKTDHNGEWKLQVLQFIRDYICEFYGGVYAINYEDIYQMINQIYMSLLGEYPNPLVKSFLDQNQDRILAMYTNVGARDYNIKDLFKELQSHVWDKVIENFKIRKCSFCAVEGFWSSVCSDAGNIDIFTLNHDSVFEKLFYKKSIDFVDGFEVDQNEDLRVWNHRAFEKKAKIKLYKLHGSITWTFCRKETLETYCSKPIDERCDFKSQPGTSSNGITIRGLSEILIGTYDKMLEYTGGIFTDLFWHFKRVLYETSLLIVCGYGFRDKGINNYLIDWLNGKENRKMAIIHPAIDQVMAKKASPAINCYWQRNKGRFIEIQGRMGSITWDFVKEKIKDCLQRI